MRARPTNIRLHRFSPIQHFPSQNSGKMVYLVCSVCLVYLVVLVCFVQPQRNQTDQMNQTDRTDQTDQSDIYLSLMLSLIDFSNGLRRYSITRRWPVLISTVTAMPGDRLTCLPSTRMVDRSMLTRVG